MTCRHGMPDRFGCDDCCIAQLSEQIDTLTMERDAARNALNYMLQANKHVATVVSWTNGSYWRNYKVEWHDNYLPEGTLLFAKIPSKPTTTDEA